jgi:predicted Fe-S protein YdhL (DUF1289 family)
MSNTRTYGRGWLDVINWITMSPAEKEAVWVQIEKDAYGARWRKPKNVAGELENEAPAAGRRFAPTR